MTKHRTAPIARRFRKALVIAPAVALLPLPAAAQLRNLSCTPEEECHVAPYFHGTGGFVGKARAGATEVAVVIVCGDTSTERTYTPGASGRVAQAIAGSDACPDGVIGALVTDGLEDGGWYYMNDTTSSAVAPLIPLTVLSDPARTQQPYDPGGLTARTGPSITINGRTHSDIGTFLKHDPSGRVGLFPHAAATRRSPRCSVPAASGPGNQCFLNAVYTAQVRVTVGESSTVYGNGDTITRNGPGGADLTLVPEVDAAGNVPNDDVAFNAFKGGNVPTVTGTGNHGIAAPGGTVNSVDISPADGADQRCAASNPDRGTKLPVKWTFAAADIEGDAPAVTTDLEVEVMVACPTAASSSHLGVELVPDALPSDG